MNDNSGFEKSYLWERSFQSVTDKSSLREGNIIYGNLPYDVRQVKARKFSSGKIDVLVSTGAIGLGLNLPIKRIVFLETTKYDSVTHRTLHVDEAKQIAGRAGQLRILEEGRYTYDISVTPVSGLVNAVAPRIKYARIGFFEPLVGIQGSLSEMFMRVSSGYRRN